MNEFSLISTYFAPLTAGNKGALGLQDDAALITQQPGMQLAITTDVITENVHFFTGDDPFNLARKLLRVNLSDLASMGATALYYLLGCVLPKTTNEAWVQRFTEGLAADNNEFNVQLLGGDTVSQQGPLTLSLTAIGQLPEGRALTRSNAKVGDDIYVSGTIGDASLALQILKDFIPPPSPEIKSALLSRYYLPLPRMELGKALLPLANSAMDISDGLLQDAEHIARYSHVKLAIQTDKIPLSIAARTLLTATPQLYPLIVSGGDDYELLFTAPPTARTALCLVSAQTRTPLTKIGIATEGMGVVMVDDQGNEQNIDKKGYQHF